MRQRRWNGAVRLLMAAALVVTGLPLLAPWWPRPPLAPRPPGPADAGPVPGRIVVDARDTLTAAERATLNARYGLSLAENSVHAAEEKLLVSDVAPGQEAAILARLRKDPLVEAAEPLHRYRAFWTPNDPRFSEQWNMKLVGAEKAWDGARGKGVTVAVIDTGVAFEKDDRCYRAVDFDRTAFVRGYDFVHDDDHPNDDHGHGTHVAGTIAESTNNGEGVAGLAPEAAIMPLKVLDQFGSGTSADIADAIRFAADHGARIINMSLGGPFPDAVMRSACQYAANKGVLIVCAAGNSRGGPVGYPAAFPECLAVSAVGPTGELAPYSSVGKEVGIAAPGGDTSQGEEYGVLQNTVRYDYEGKLEEDGYFFFQGTSMASPHVAAVAALAMSRGVTDAAQVKQLLQTAAVPREPREQYGAGVLSAAETVRLAGAAAGQPVLKLFLTVLIGLLGVLLALLRSSAAGAARLSSAPFGFALGFAGPDLFLAWLGYASPLNIVVHSALIPLYLLWEAESRAWYRFVAAMALGVAIHLAWDALRGHVPFAEMLPAQALPWLWVNACVGVGVALVAYRRSLAK